MSIIQTLTGHRPPSELRKFFHDSYPFPDVSTRENWEGFVQQEESKIAGRIHDDATRFVDADPLVRLMADEMEAELLDTARRGRRG